jgi:hypothetical protein
MNLVKKREEKKITIFSTLDEQIKVFELVVYFFCPWENVLTLWQLKKKKLRTVFKMLHLKKVFL